MHGGHGLCCLIGLGCLAVGLVLGWGFWGRWLSRCDRCLEDQRFWRDRFGQSRPRLVVYHGDGVNDDAA